MTFFKEGLAHFQIDILDNLKRINKTRYDSDADFQQDLSDLFIRLRDPHTYVLPLLPSIILAHSFSELMSNLLNVMPHLPSNHSHLALRMDTTLLAWFQTIPTAFRH